MKLALSMIFSFAIFFLFTAGCSQVVPVKQTEMAVEINGSSGEWNTSLVSGGTIKVGSFCRLNCDDVHIFESHQEIQSVDSLYAMPKSNDLDLGLGLSLKLTLNRSGTKDELRERLQSVANRYQYSVQGSSTDNQIFRTKLSTIISIDLSEAQVKSKVRPILEKFDLSSAYYNIAKNGSIIRDIEAAIKQHLIDIKSPLILLSIEVNNISQPPQILSKKQEEESMISQESIHAKQLDLKEKRLMRMQLIRLKEAQFELEMFELNRPYMTPEAIAYKWTQVAETYAEAGLPFAVTPEMLLPAIQQLTSISVDTSKAISKAKSRINEIENQLEHQADCAEGEGCETVPTPEVK